MYWLPILCHRLCLVMGIQWCSKWGWSSHGIYNVVWIRAILVHTKAVLPLDLKQMEPYLFKLSPLQVPVFWGRGGGEVSNNVKPFLVTVMNRFPKAIPRKGKVLLPKNEYLIGAISGTKAGRKGRDLGSVNIPGCPDISQPNLPFHISTLRNHIYSFSLFTASVKQDWLLVRTSPQISPQRRMSSAPTLKVALVSVTLHVYLPFHWEWNLPVLWNNIWGALWVLTCRRMATEGHPGTALRLRRLPQRAMCAGK